MAFKIQQTISNLAKNQLPEFYKADESFLVDFVQAYYEWMEQVGEVNYFSRNLLNLTDIDDTLDQFVLNFKNTYMADLPLNTKTDTRTLLKHVSDLYKSKGSYQSFKLLFRILFNMDASLYYPGADVIKASDGVWKEPVYLELSTEWKTKTFISQEIIGEKSGATAFVDSRVRRLISGGVVDVLFISSLKGSFQLGERVTSKLDNSFDGAPVVKGSLTTIDVIQGGKNNVIGDVFDVVSDFGNEGQARVTSLESGTGKVDFILNSGGYGYTADSRTSVLVSEEVITLSNIENRNKLNNLISNIDLNWGLLDNQSTHWGSTKTAADSWVFDISSWTNRRNEYWQITGHATATAGIKSLEANISQGRDYRFLIPFKVVDSTTSGSLTLKVSPGTSKVLNLDGTVADETFLTVNFSTAGLTAGTWYVAVGYVYKHNHVGTTSQGGVYEVFTGNKIGFITIPFKSFKWKSPSTLSITTANIEIKQTGNLDVNSVRYLGKPVIQVLDTSISDVDFAKTGYQGKYTDINDFDIVTQPLVEITVVAQTGTFVVGDYITSRTVNISGPIIAHGYVISDDGVGNVAVVSINGTWGAGAFIVTASQNAVITSINGGLGETVKNVISTSTGSDINGFGVHGIIQNTFKTVKNNFLTTSSNNVIGDIVSLSTGTGATFSIAIPPTGNETVSIYTEFIGDSNYKGVSYPSIFIDGGGSQVGYIKGFNTLTSGGTAYMGNGKPGSNEIIFKGGGLGTGANPTGTGNSFAVGRIITAANDLITPSPITGIEMFLPGAGYSSTPAITNWVITTVAGAGISATALLDFSYGFIKAKHGDLTNIIDLVLTSGNFTLGPITSLAFINPGSNYNTDPFVIVINPYISGFNRRDLILNISNPSGIFTLGEEISQTITSTAVSLTVADSSIFSANDGILQKKQLKRLTLSSVSPFQVGMSVEQQVTTAKGVIKTVDRTNKTVDIDVNSGTFDVAAGHTLSWVFAVGVLRNPTVVSSVVSILINNALATVKTITDATHIDITPLNNTSGNFTSSNVLPLSNILYLASDENITTLITVAPSTFVQNEGFAKGTVKSVLGNRMFLKRTSFGLDFDQTSLNTQLTGGSSGVTTTLVSAVQDGSVRPIGLNADVSSSVSIANGIVKTVEVIDSGFGYLDKETVTLSKIGNNFIVSGRANIIKQGIGSGFWQNTNGFLNSDKFIHDNDYYQAFSYEIQVGLSLNKYKDIIKKILHTSGTKLFAGVVLETNKNMSLQMTDSSVTQV